MLPSIFSADGPENDARFRLDTLERLELATARKWILLVGALYLVGAVLFLGLREPRVGPGVQLQVVLVAVALFLGHLLLWWYVVQQPLTAAIVALGFFVLVIAVDGLMDPSRITQGLLVKALGGFGLGRAVMAARAVERLREERALSPAGTS